MLAHRMAKSVPEITALQARWFRLRRNGLVEPFATAEHAARELAGIQAQILTAAGLALRSRVAGLGSWSAVLEALAQRRSLVKLWGQRGTLHLYATADWPILCGALAGQQTWWHRQALRDPASAPIYAEAVKELGRLLKERGTLTRDEARVAGLGLPEHCFSSWGGIFADLVRAGTACHVPTTGTEGRFAHRAYWLPSLHWHPPAVDDANVDFARRYLRSYGPARVQDLAYWRGTTVASAARWIGALGHEVAECRLEGIAHLALREDAEALGQRPPARDRWPVRLLGRFDPMLLSHKDKSWVIAPDHQNRVWRPAGHIEATLLVHGRIAGTWRYDRVAGGLGITLIPLAPLSRQVAAAVEREAGRVAHFLGEPLTDLSLRRPAAPRAPGR